MTKEKMAMFNETNCFLKSFTIDKLYESEDENNKYHFSGYLAYYENVDRDGDRFKKGAFTEAINKRKVYPLYYNHKTWGLENAVGDLFVEDTEKGVYAYGTFYDDIDDNNIKKAMRMVKRGALVEMSIGFGIEDISTDAKLNENNDPESWVRKYDFLKAYIREGSIVVTPSNPEAKIEQKSTEETTLNSEDKLTRKEQIEKALEQIEKRIKEK